VQTAKSSKYLLTPAKIKISESGEDRTSWRRWQARLRGWGSKRKQFEASQGTGKMYPVSGIFRKQRRISRVVDRRTNWEVRFRRRTMV